MLDQQNHATGGANGSIMVGMFVYLCLASKKPSEQKFFVPTRTDLGVKLLKKVSSKISVFIFAIYILQDERPYVLGSWWLRAMGAYVPLIVYMTESSFSIAWKE